MKEDEGHVQYKVGYRQSACKVPCHGITYKKYNCLYKLKSNVTHLALEDQQKG